ncbi:MAG TPA: sodium:solute symporter [Bacteroidota bacterium]|nr:sodium:solute symporter [Bacteroidota bacterium]
MGFAAIDYVILVVYLGGIAFLGYLQRGKQATASDYFLGKDVIPWWVVCFSVVAAETSSLTFISIPGLAYATNMGFLQVTLGYLLGRILVSIFLLPAYYGGELSTAYAYLERRFGLQTRRFASVVFLLTRTAADGVRLFATAIPLKLILNIDYPFAIAIIAAVALAYTTFGGVRGVVWVDALQMLVYLGGALLTVFVLIYQSEGGLAALIQPAMEAGKFQIFDWGWTGDFFKKPYTVLGGLFGGAFLSMASHGTDQLIVQRVLTTKSLPNSRKALIGSGIVVILQFALFLFVGLLLYGHYAGAQLSQLGLVRADEIFPDFIIHGLPPGVSGFIIAGLFAAALSSLSGSMSSLASSTMLDLYKPYAGLRLTPEKEFAMARRITVGWGILLVGSATFFMTSGQTVVELALSIASFTYGGLLGTFLLGVLVRKADQSVALISFVASIVTMLIVVTSGLVAWTWFTVVGTAVTLIVGFSLSRFRTVSAGKE